MNSSLIQLLVLAGIAIFLILKLRSVLGTREGFEKPAVAESAPSPRAKFEVIEGGPDRDITDNTADPAATAALAAMKAAEPSFNVTDFLKGARQAYEMILMAFDKGDLAQIKPFLGEDVLATFTAAINDRENQGLKIESTFAGVRDMALTEATYDPATKTAEIAVRYTGELYRTVRDKSGTVVEGGPSAIVRQRDTWTFSRRMGVNDPNWQLSATGD
ncbi:MAG: Tim44/TimA family putative adaptor protein [Paracoccaceae bacterium]